MAAHNFAARSNFAGQAFGGRNFAAHGFRNGFGGAGYGGGYWGGFNGYGYGGWAGPVFWPFAFDEIFGYVFSPWYYYEPFWGYGPYDVLAALYWPYDWVPSYAEGSWGAPYGYGNGSSYGRAYASSHARRHVARAERNPAEVGAQGPIRAAQMCADATSLIGLSTDDIDRTVQPTGEQRADLDALKAVFARANEILAASCPNQPPLTPPGRLEAMEKRIEAMLQAVETVQEPLTRFYDSLNDEQKARLDAMRVGEGPKPAAGGGHGHEAVASSLEVCRAQTPDAASFPEQEIKKVVNPTGAQSTALEELRNASLRGAELMKNSCPAQMPSTPTGRLAAVKTRLDAMLQAVKTELPAMDKFYSSLSDEQKARFNAMRPEQSATRQG